MYMELNYQKQTYKIVSLVKAGDLTKAKALVKTGLLLEPNNPSLLYLKAWLNEEKKEFPQGITNGERLLLKSLDSENEIQTLESYEYDVTRFYDYKLTFLKKKQKTRLPDLIITIIGCVLYLVLMLTSLTFPSKILHFTLIFTLIIPSVMISVSSARLIFRKKNLFYEFFVVLFLIFFVSYLRFIKDMSFLKHLERTALAFWEFLLDWIERTDFRL